MMVFILTEFQNFLIFFWSFVLYLVWDIFPPPLSCQRVPLEAFRSQTVGTLFCAHSQVACLYASAESASTVQPAHRLRVKTTAKF